MGSLSLLESNQGLLRCRKILYQLSYQGSPCDFKVKTKQTKPGPHPVRLASGLWADQWVRPGVATSQVEGALVPPVCRAAGR